MFARLWWLGICSVTMACGCSTTSCCNWWGRNSDSSSNLSRNKPTPVQQGPLAGTYQRPGNSTVSPIQQSPSGTQQGTGNQQTPVITTVPPAQQPAGDSSPLLTPPAMNPPSPPSGVVPSQYQPTGSVTPMPGSPLGSANTLPDNMPSIPVPSQPGPVVSMPQVQAPALDLNIMGNSAPGNGSAANNPPAASPLLFGASSSKPTQASIPAPLIEMPNVAPPAIIMPLEPSMPNVATGKKPNTLNPGTAPPPLPPPPSIPTLDKK